ncbi:MAG: thiol-disulfide isomerase [Gammaproteobacteria bacterium]|nr:thiol-disulfide isomerase [Gammaproteobacteria bacterium]
MPLNPGDRPMVDALAISNIILWVLVIVLALLVFALTRQVGILHERVAPAGALQPTNGPKVGELTEALQLKSIDGANLTIGGPDTNQLASFVLFISPTCPVCKSLVPTARSLVKSEASRMRLVFASDGDNVEKHRLYVEDLDIAEYPYVLSELLGITYQVSKLPFALLIGSNGTLQSKGLVNTREHMESLIEAMDSGISTVQEYIGSQEKPNNRNYESSPMEQSS